jgi:heat shock protein HslJ
MRAAPLPFALLLAACAPAPQGPGEVLFRAVGNEPGWGLTVDRQHMDYVGDYGETRISEPTPPDFEPRTGIWRSGRLDVTIAPGPCSDGMSDLVYRLTVSVNAAGNAVSGCGGGTIPSSTLAGTSWSVVSVNGRPTPRGDRYFIRFEEARLSAQFGCNGMGGDYSLNGDHLSVPSLEQTLMGCPEPAMRFENEGGAVLRSNVRVERPDGRRMRLVSEAGSIDLELAI